MLRGGELERAILVWVSAFIVVGVVVGSAVTCAWQAIPDFEISIEVVGDE